MRTFSCNYANGEAIHGHCIRRRVLDGERMDDAAECYDERYEEGGPGGALLGHFVLNLSFPFEAPFFLHFQPPHFQSPLLGRGLPTSPFDIGRARAFLAHLNTTIDHDVPIRPSDGSATRGSASRCAGAERVRVHGCATLCCKKCQELYVAPEAGRARWGPRSGDHVRTFRTATVRPGDGEARWAPGKDGDGRALAGVSQSVLVRPAQLASP